MTIQAGTQLGPYEITSLIGAGGMGEVYRARDIRLGRIVAIKVLPTRFPNQSELRERFEREAQTISNLNHPNICTLHDIGRQDEIDYLVMEYLEGETLAARLERGALPLDETLKIAADIGAALDKAHRSGVVHRDLKPANVILTRNGPKLLDFGLAKLRSGGGSQPIPVSVSALPTDAANLTAAGTVLGTLQYMSPEQLEGREADNRADIFAFGSMLYEMLTGRKAFSGKSQVSLMASILEHEPPRMSDLKPLTPRALEDVVAGCLAKNPDDRWQDIRDVVRQLKQIETRPAAAAIEPAVPDRRPRWVIAPAVLSLVLASILLVLYLVPHNETARTIVRFEVFPPKDMAFPGANYVPRFAVSPDGKYIAYSASRGGQPYGPLWTRRLDSVEAKMIPNTDNAQQPLWSPDSQTIAFFSDDKLKKVDVNGGPVQTLCNAPGQNFTGTWNRDGVILFGTQDTKGIQRVSSAGGVPVQVTSAQDGKETAHLYPQFLADGDHFLYRAVASGPENGNTYIASLHTAGRKLLFKSDSSVGFAPPDHLLFLRDGALLTQQINMKTFELIGEPVAVAESVSSAGNGRSGFSLSQNGIIAYSPGTNATGEPLQFVWVDRAGKVLNKVGAQAVYRSFDLSRDLKQIATHREEGRSGGDIYLMDADIPEPPLRRFTFDPKVHHVSPVWSPDGKFVYYAKLEGNATGLFRKDAAGVQSEQKLLETEAGTIAAPLDTSPDGKWLLFQKGGGTNASLWTLSLADGKQVRYSPENEPAAAGRISPDGKWVAYVSRRSGFAQIHVASFPSHAVIFQPTTTDGNLPQWRRDGKELFFTINPEQLTAVSVESSGGSLKFGVPQPLFDIDLGPVAHTGPATVYVPSADGQRFLLARPASAVTTDIRVQPLIVVLNWDAALRKQ